LKKKHSEKALAGLTWGAAILTLGTLAFLVLFILARGVPHLKPSLFAWEYDSENVSLLPSLISTALITLYSLGIAVPLGVGAAVFLAEYAKRGSFAVKLIRVTAETLAGIPSIVYGLFGLLFFVETLLRRWGKGPSILAGTLTLSIMILPLILRASEEALKAVPDTYREAAFGMGAGRLRTVFRVVLPGAMPGILAGVILAVGRIVGETAALIYTAGAVPQVPPDAMASARTLSVHMYALSNEGLYMNESYATAVVLLVLVAGINTLSGWIARRLGRNTSGRV
jgi:phosphate transport system permease protein